MDALTYIDHARQMAAFLEDRETGAGGDRETARARLAARYGIAGSIFHALRYRPPKQIAADIYNRLCSAVEDAASKQIKALENEIAMARASSLRPREDMVRKAEAVLVEVKALMEGGTYADR